MEARSKVIVRKANIIYPVDNYYCVSMVILTVCTIFVVVLLKCYKITKLHYNFGRIFFSICAEVAE